MLEVLITSCHFKNLWQLILGQSIIVFCYLIHSIIVCFYCWFTNRTMDEGWRIKQIVSVQCHSFFFLCSNDQDTKNIMRFTKSQNKTEQQIWVIRVLWYIFHCFCLLFLEGVMADEIFVLGFEMSLACIKYYIL